MLNIASGGEDEGRKPNMMVRYDSVGGVQGYGTITKEVPAPLTLSLTAYVKPSRVAPGYAVEA